MANEKLEVAEELIAHFEDGVQRGRGVASMIEDFGDPQVAAQLIARIGAARIGAIHLTS